MGKTIRLNIDHSQDGRAVAFTAMRQDARASQDAVRRAQRDAIAARAGKVYSGDAAGVQMLCGMTPTDA